MGLSRPLLPDRNKANGAGMLAALSAAKSYQELKSTLHRELLNKIDLERLTSLQDTRARMHVQGVIYDLIGVLNTPLSATDKERLCREVLHEVFGLGPLEPLLQDPTISDILVTTPKMTYVERRGLLVETEVEFKDEEHLVRVIEKIASRVGR